MLDTFDAINIFEYRIQNLLTTTVSTIPIVGLIQCLVKAI